MADRAFYKAKIAECLQLLEGSNDPLYRDVYRAMADEFADKLAAITRIAVESLPAEVPPSALLHQTVRPGAAGDLEQGGLPQGLTAGRGHGHDVDRRRRKRAPGMVTLRPVV
jgi:hypothetical protein